MTNRPERSLRERLQTYCQAKFLAALDSSHSARLERYVLSLIDEGAHAPMHGRGVAWSEVARATDIPLATIRDLSPLLRPAFDAIARAFPKSRPSNRSPRLAKARSASSLVVLPGTSDTPRHAGPILKPVASSTTPRASAKRGPKLRPIVEFPTPSTEHWIEVPGFAAALDLHIRRHGDTVWSLHRALVRPGEAFNRTTLKSWRLGTREPRSLESRDMLSRIERRYGLPGGYFSAKFAHPSRSAAGYVVAKRSEQRRLAWHLPSDFETRSAAEQAEIVAWVRSTIISGTTEYRRYQSAASKHRFGLRFPKSTPGGSGDADAPKAASPLDAPPALASEMTALLAFKTAPLTALGYQRNGTWGRRPPLRRSSIYL